MQRKDDPTALSPVRAQPVLALRCFFCMHSSKTKRPPCFIDCMCGNVCVCVCACVYVYVCVCMCITLVPGAQRGETRESDLELELQTVVSCQVRAGN